MSESADKIGMNMRRFRSEEYTEREHTLLDALWMVAFGSMGHGDGPDLYMARTIAFEALEQAGEVIPNDMRMRRN